MRAVAHEFRSSPWSSGRSKPEPGLERVIDRVKPRGCATTPPTVTGQSSRLFRLYGSRGRGIDEPRFGVTEVRGDQIRGCRLRLRAYEYYTPSGRWPRLSTRDGFSFRWNMHYARGFAKYVGKVPKGVNFFPDYPLTCAGATTYKAVRGIGVRSSNLVAVFGFGGLRASRALQ